MMRFFNKKQLLLLGGTLLVFVLVFILLYFYLLDPVKKELSSKTSELKNEEQILEMVQTKAGTGMSVDFESTTELQKRLPVQPLTDQFVLNLEKAEVVSNSFIVDMAFTDGDTPVEPELPEATGEEKPAATDEASESTDTNDQASEDEGKDTTDSKKSTTETQDHTVLEAPGTLPNSLKKLSATMNVRSSSYDEMLEFIQSIQATNRIFTIDSLTFEGAEEVRTRDQSVEPLEYGLTVSAYYYPSLTDLQEQTPTVVTPKPSEKKNPFSRNERDDADSDTGN
ncbi:hypothetical protein ACQKL5_00915 [Peribacillus sp. NPDC097675]|uniref:hypothetical protein n=1 Tax=Peribacillus sp. NPDC097675 TaxID=3390618 RepID=UPI003D0042C2